MDCSMPSFPVHLQLPELAQTQLHRVSDAIQPVETTDHLLVSIAVPFLDCHVIGSKQYEVFSDWLLSLSNIHLSLLHVFSRLDSSFLFQSVQLLSHV